MADNGVNFRHCVALISATLGFAMLETTGAHTSHLWVCAHVLTRFQPLVLYEIKPIPTKIEPPQRAALHPNSAHHREAGRRSPPAVGLGWGAMSLQSTITSEVEGRKLSTVICCCLFYGGRRCLSFLLFSVFMATMILISTQAQEVNTSKALGHCSCGVFAGTSRDLIYTIFLVKETQKDLSLNKPFQ